MEVLNYILPNFNPSLLVRRIKIWSAEDGSCPVTLAGHSAPVTDTAIVDQGMNIVSTSKYAGNVGF